MSNFGNITSIKGWFNRVTQTVVINIFGRSKIVPLGKFVKDYRIDIDFMTCEKLTKAIAVLQNETDDVQLVAMGGMGKSRLLYEAFKDIIPDNSYYCYFSQGDSFNKDLDTFFQDEQHKEGLLILDDCPNDSIQYCISQRNNHGSNIRLIFTHHDFFERKNYPDTIMVEIFSSDTKEMVDQYIQNRVYHGDQDRFICDCIKEMADGYPQMAILLTDAYEKKGSIGVDDVEILMEELLGKNDDGQMKALKCLSLFQPLGYRPPVEEQYNAVLGNSILTGMYGSIDERKDTFDRCINHFKGEIVEVGSSWLNVRPLPLAIWLIGKWLGEHSEERLMQLIDDFDKLPKRIATQLGNQMYRRLRNMAGNDRASLLIGELCRRYSESPFGAEGVVCSELGSRLFLAFAHVNHLETAECIHGVIAGKSIEELEESLNSNVKRNIVWTLEKLCYPTDSFEMAAMDLMKLALAENEGIGNNATGQLIQLFHILLPGTTANLQARVTLLRQWQNQGRDYVPMLLKCLDNSFVAGGFTRMGGADEFGTTKYVDYIPKEDEVTQYWKDCAQVLIEVLNSNPETLTEVKRIIEDRCYQLLHKGRIDVVDVLTKAVHEKEGGEWMKMYTHFFDAKNHFYAAYSQENKEIIDGWLDTLKPLNFCNLLKEVRMKVYNGDHNNFEDEFTYAQDLLKPLADKFINGGLYEQHKEIEALVHDREYFDFGFSRMLTDRMDDNQLETMLTCFKSVLEKERDDIHSPFFYIFCQHLKGREPFERFTYNLRDNGHESVYVHLLANIEDENLTILQQLEDEVAHQKIGKQAIEGYLFQVGMMTSDMMLQVLKDTTVREKATVYDLVGFIRRFQFGHHVTEHAELLQEVKKLLLLYEYDEKNPSNNSDYTSFVIRILEKNHDSEFAKAICHKMIELMNKTYVHSNFEHIFYVLLNTYIDDVWDEFSEKFVDEAYAGFYYQVYNEVGSGFDFGRGVMYQHGDDRIKELCQKHPEHAPYCVGHTCPVFKYVKDEKGQMVNAGQFSDIMIWLLENYGHQDKTLDGAGGNIGSFSWSGSTIGLFNTLVECFKQVKANHKMHGKVKKWAEDHIKYYEQQLREEQGRIDFERMHYK